MLINTQRELKQAVTGLRRELKALYGAKAPSHSQCLELVAKALGKSSYAELLPGLPDEPKSVTPAVARYPLSNKFGLFDLVEKGEEGQVVDGLSFELMEGTVDDIFYCVASASTATRESSGGLSPGYEGGTEVNWDGQETRKNSKGDNLWEAGNGTPLSEGYCILVPTWFDSADDEDTAYDLPNREPLLNAYLDYAKEHQLFDKLKAELPQDKLESKTLQAIADVLGFGIHLGEWVSLKALVA